MKMEGEHVEKKGLSMIALEAKKFVSSTETKKIVYNFETINFSTHVYQNFFSCFSEYYLPWKLWTFFLFTLYRFKNTIENCSSCYTKRLDFYGNS